MPISGGSIDCDGDYSQHTGKSTSALLPAWRAVLTHTPRHQGHAPGRDGDGHRRRSRVASYCADRVKSEWSRAPNQHWPRPQCMSLYSCPCTRLSPRSSPRSACPVSQNISTDRLAFMFASILAVAAVDFPVDLIGILHSLPRASGQGRKRGRAVNINSVWLKKRSKNVLPIPDDGSIHLWVTLILRGQGGRILAARTSAIRSRTQWGCVNRPLGIGGLRQ